MSNVPNFSFVNENQRTLGQTGGRPARIVACNECRRRRARVSDERKHEENM